MHVIAISEWSARPSASSPTARCGAKVIPTLRHRLEGVEIDSRRPSRADAGAGRRTLVPRVVGKVRPATRGSARHGYARNTDRKAKITPAGPHDDAAGPRTSSTRTRRLAMAYAVASTRRRATAGRREDVIQLASRGAQRSRRARRFAVQGDHRALEGITCRPSCNLCVRPMRFCQQTHTTHTPCRSRIILSELRIRKRSRSRSNPRSRNIDLGGLRLSSKTIMLGVTQSRRPDRRAPRAGRRAPSAPP